MKIHPAADVLPEMPDDDFKSLCKSIDEAEQQVSIKLYRGQILDGRHRYRACKKLRIEPWTEDVTNELRQQQLSPEAFVLAHNLERRHLPDGARALILAELRKMESGAKSADPAHDVGVSKRQFQKAERVSNDGSAELKRKVVAGEVSLNRADKIAALPKGEQHQEIAKPPKKREPAKAGKMSSSAFAKAIAPIMRAADDAGAGAKAKKIILDLQRIVCD